MKYLTVAFLYNVRHKYPDPNHPRTQLEADFDDPVTIKEIIRHLKECGFKVLPIEADESAYFRLLKARDKIDIAFNFSEGIYGQDREAQMPAILEMLQIPYTGSGPLAQALMLNKAKTKEVLKAYGVPVLDSYIVHPKKIEIPSSIKFPLIVKPLAQGSSAGITNDSVVSNNNQLKKQVNYVMGIFNQPVMLEPFIKGREFSAAMLGNPPQILPIIESDHSHLPKDYNPIDSLEVKWYFEEERGSNHLICPAKLDKKLKNKIEKICLATWHALGIRDYCRIDIRCDEKNNPFILEVNSPPGLIPPKISTTSYFPLAASKAGMTYNELLKTIIGNARNRYKK